MALNIRNPEADALAAELARETGETKTEAVTQALRERLERVRQGRAPRSLVDKLNAIAKRSAALPALDDRTDDEILGYGPDGLPS
jgi:antitoxin VapB